MLMCFAATSNAQTATVKEKLPDGSYIVTITDGIIADYRALPPSKIREILKDKEELAGLRISNSETLKKFAEFQKLSEEQLRTEKEVSALMIRQERIQTDFYRSEYEKEKKLRISFGDTLASCKKFLWWRIC